MSAEKSKLAPNRAKIQATIVGIHDAKNDNGDHAKKISRGSSGWWGLCDMWSWLHYLPLDCAPDFEGPFKSSMVAFRFGSNWM